MRGNSRKGAAVVELSLIFVPFFFMMLACLEVSRAMWIYHTLTSAVKKGTRVASVHGAGCVDASASCPATIREVARVIRDWGIGLNPNEVQVTFFSGNQSRTCGTLAQCLTDSSRWPEPPSNASGSPVAIEARYPFVSVVSSFWPGGLPAVFQLRANSTETIQF
jgi:hypothetical protein